LIVLTIDCYSTNENHISKLLFYFQMKFPLCEANADQAASSPLGPGSIPATGSRSTHKVRKFYLLEN